MNTINYEWATFFIDVKTLAKLVEKEKIDSLLIITRGGMFLGAMLSEILGIKIVETISINSYEDKEKKALIVYKQPNRTLQNPLIIDDICDTGETLKFVSDMYKTAPTLTLFYKPTAVFKPKYYLHEVTSWIKFPWEYEKKEVK